jgi:hypothetical protein
LTRASARTNAATLGIGQSTVQDYLAHAASIGLVWPLAPEPFRPMSIASPEHDARRRDEGGLAACPVPGKAAR